MAPQSSSQQLAAQAKNSQYLNTVLDFVRRRNGLFIAVTDDQAFLSVLRTVLGKHLGLVPSDILVTEHDVVRTLKAVSDANKNGGAPLLFLERNINGQDTTLTVKQLKTAFPELLIIILSVEVSKERLMYLHEVGADNFIAKPISAQTVIEKLAFTIKPQSQLGQLIDEAKGLLRDGQAAQAKATALRILEMKKSSPAGLMVLGDAELALGDPDAAKKAYLEAGNNAELYLDPLRKLAQLAEHTGNLEESLNYLEKLDKLSPLNSERKFDMGKINLDLGHEEKAQGLFQAALDQVAKDSMDRIGDLAERIAGIYAESDPGRSELFLRKALDVKKNRLSREDLRIFNRLGINLRRQGKWREAVDEYKRALRIAPDDEHLLYNLALAHAEGDMPDEARKNMEKALKINPGLPGSSAEVGYRMGLVFMRAAARDKAVMCLNAALKIQPGMKKALEALEKLK